MAHRRLIPIAPRANLSRFLTDPFDSTPIDPRAVTLNSYQLVLCNLNSASLVIAFVILCKVWPTRQEIIGTEVT